MNLWGETRLSPWQPPTFKSCVGTKCTKACREESLGWYLALVNIQWTATAAALLSQGSQPALPPTPFYICYKIVHMFIRGKKASCAFRFLWSSLLSVYFYAHGRAYVLSCCQSKGMCVVCSTVMEFICCKRKLLISLKCSLSRHAWVTFFSAAMLALIFTDHFWLAHALSLLGSRVLSFIEELRKWVSHWQTPVAQLAPGILPGRLLAL